MYFTPRGVDEREQRILDCSTAQRYLELAVSGADLSEFFTVMGINRIVIAAANHFGKCLIRSLENKSIEICCFVDQAFYKFDKGLCMGIPVISYSELKGYVDVDAVIVASNYYLNEITDSLLEQGIKLEQIFSINDILFGMGRFKG